MSITVHTAPEDDKVCLILRKHPSGEKYDVLRNTPRNPSLYAPKLKIRGVIPPNLRMKLMSPEPMADYMGGMLGALHGIQEFNDRYNLCHKNINLKALIASVTKRKRKGEKEAIDEGFIVDLDIWDRDAGPIHFASRASVFKAMRIAAFYGESGLRYVERTVEKQRRELREENEAGPSTRK